jgi:hypothetical protein
MGSSWLPSLWHCPFNYQKYVLTHYHIEKFFDSFIEKKLKTFWGINQAPIGANYWRKITENKNLRRLSLRLNKPYTVSLHFKHNSLLQGPLNFYRSLSKRKGFNRVKFQIYNTELGGLCVWSPSAPLYYNHIDAKDQEPLVKPSSMASSM